MEEALVFEQSMPGKCGVSLPALTVNKESLDTLVPTAFRRWTDAPLPELSEPEVVRHFVRLSQKNFSVDTHFYPLGSCTMKYNPKINEDMVRLPGLSTLHPYTPVSHAQGMLHLLGELEESLCALTGMDRFTLQPAAGAHGELTGMLLVKAYHQKRGDLKRTKVIVPDSSHGTNPATAGILGYQIVQVKSHRSGRVDLDELRKVLDDTCACLMLTNPNTVGLFESDIQTIQALVHAQGGLLYYDGANMNAMMGLVRPGDMGFDIVHVNLHKTFSTPHGGGGPGAGPVGVKKALIPFLPEPLIEKKKDAYVLSPGTKDSIGKVKAFYGNIGVLLKAYCYIRIMGKDGLTQATIDAIINANYIKARLQDVYVFPYTDHCMHECVLTTQKYAQQGLHSIDFGKRLLDYGFHAPTVAFPLIVPDALMIEPTETESKQTLDAFIDAMRAILNEAETQPELIKNAPHTLECKRCDEVFAARNPNLQFTCSSSV